MAKKKEKKAALSAATDVGLREDGLGGVTEDGMGGLTEDFEAEGSADPSSGLQSFTAIASGTNSSALSITSATDAGGNVAMTYGFNDQTFARVTTGNMTINCTNSELQTRVDELPKIINNTITFNVTDNGNHGNADFRGRSGNGTININGAFPMDFNCGNFMGNVINLNITVGYRLSLFGTGTRINVSDTSVISGKAYNYVRKGYIRDGCTVWFNNTDLSGYSWDSYNVWYLVNNSTVIVNCDVDKMPDFTGKNNNFIGVDKNSKLIFTNEPVGIWQSNITGANSYDGGTITVAGKQLKPAIAQSVSLDGGTPVLPDLSGNVNLLFDSTFVRSSYGTPVYQCTAGNVQSIIDSLPEVIKSVVTLDFFSSDPTVDVYMDFGSRVGGTGGGYSYSINFVLNNYIRFLSLANFNGTIQITTSGSPTGFAGIQASGRGTKLIISSIDTVGDETVTTLSSVDGAHIKADYYPINWSNVHTKAYYPVFYAGSGGSIDVSTYSPTTMPVESDEGKIFETDSGGIITCDIMPAVWTRKPTDDSGILIVDGVQYSPAQVGLTNVMTYEPLTGTGYSFTGTVQQCNEYIATLPYEMLGCSIKVTATSNVNVASLNFLGKSVYGQGGIHVECTSHDSGIPYIKELEIYNAVGVVQLDIIGSTSVRVSGGGMYVLIPNGNLSSSSPTVYTVDGNSVLEMNDSNGGYPCPKLVARRGGTLYMRADGDLILPSETRICFETEHAGRIYVSFYTDIPDIPTAYLENDGTGTLVLSERLTGTALQIYPAVTVQEYKRSIK